MKTQEIEEMEPEFNRYIGEALSRRAFMSGTGSAGIVAFFGADALEAGVKDSPILGFEGIAASTIDEVIVPEGYNVDVLISWGDPILKGGPEFSHENDAEAQAKQFGDNNDGMTFFPIDDNRAILVVNNEYINHEHLLAKQWKAYGNQLFGHMDRAGIEKAQAAHGVSVVELMKKDGNWAVNPNGQKNRRITATTEMALHGPAAGHPLTKTESDKSGKKVFGTINNCANGETLWKTYLTCEENIHYYFNTRDEEKLEEITAKNPKLAAGYEAYGIPGYSDTPYNWHYFDDRFDLAEEPNEPHRFGWVVEIDPFDPKSTPRKRTALGRFKHENAELTTSKDGRVVVYMGDDERGEHIYKFVSKGKYDPGNPDSNRDLLDEGTLYVAKFDRAERRNDRKIQGKGRWLELTHGKGKLADADFADQAEVLIYARRAAKILGATTMDRPEWVAVHPTRAEAYCTLTNNAKRGNAPGQEHRPASPNPRANNIFGHIVKWKPADADHASDEFDWEVFVLAGNPAVYKPNNDKTDGDYLRSGSESIHKDNMFNSPDGLKFDQKRLWIMTDGKYSNDGDYAGMGNNQMLCCDPTTSPPVIKRFLTGPVGCEITGLAFCPTYRTMFVGVQHPGEDGTGSTFPGTDGHSTPRSSVMRITRKDGGIIGA